MTKREKMFRVVEAWKASGLSREKYSAKAGLSRSTFQYWTRRYAEAHAEQSAAEPVKAVVPKQSPKPSPKPAGAMPTFVHVPTAAARLPQESHGKIVITLASGTRIEVS